MAKELYVGHISEQATEEDLRKLFEIMGVVTSVHLIVDQESGEFKRCGYVRMLSEVNLNEVVETLDGTWLIDRCIVVSIAKPQKDRPAKTPFVKRRQMTSARPATADGRIAAKRPQATGTGKNAHQATAEAAPKVKSSRPVAKEATKTGRSSAAKESARKFRPAAVRDTAAGSRPAPAGKRTGRPTGKGRK